MRVSINQAQWEQVIYRGEVPKAISHGCMFFYQGRLHVFEIKTHDEQKLNLKRHRKSMLATEELKQNKTLPILFYVFNLFSSQWSHWRVEDVPQVEDFAYYFCKEKCLLWIFGGYMNGIKSNIFFNVHVNRRKINIINPDTPQSHPNAD